METYKIEGSTGKSVLLIGEALQNLAKHVPMKDAVIITDHNIWNTYHGEVPDWPVIKIESGESVKSLDTAEYIYGELLNMEADRSTFVVGIGGGVLFAILRDLWRLPICEGFGLDSLLPHYCLKWMPVLAGKTGLT